MTVQNYDRINRLTATYLDRVGRLSEMEIDITFDGHPLADYKPIKVLPSEVIEVVADVFGVTSKAIKGRSRTQPIVFARQCAAYYIYNYCCISLKKTAKEVGCSDHSTIIHGMEQWKNLCNQNEYYSSLNNQIKSLIKTYTYDNENRGDHSDVGTRQNQPC